MEKACPALEGGGKEEDVQCIFLERTFDCFLSRLEDKSVNNAGRFVPRQFARMRSRSASPTLTDRVSEAER